MASRSRKGNLYGKLSLPNKQDIKTSLRCLVIERRVTVMAEGFQGSFGLRGSRLRDMNEFPFSVIVRRKCKVKQHGHNRILPVNDVPWSQI